MAKFEQLKISAPFWQVVLVTGAGSGIGRSLAENFNRRTGYRVFATDYRLSPFPPHLAPPTFTLPALILASLRRNSKPSQHTKLRVDLSTCRADLLSDLGNPGIETLRLDVTLDESVLAAVDHIITQAGRIDICVCNAGGYGRHMTAL